MSRSRYYPGRRYRHTDLRSWGAIAAADEYDGVAEYQDHRDEGYVSECARIYMVWDMKTRHHRGRSRRFVRVCKTLRKKLRSCTLVYEDAPDYIAI